MNRGDVVGSSGCRRPRAPVTRLESDPSWGQRSLRTPGLSETREEREVRPDQTCGAETPTSDGSVGLLGLGCLLVCHEGRTPS